MKERFKIYQHIMNGFSYMLPLVVAGGLLIALSSNGLFADQMPYIHDVGLLILSYTYPLLAAYIAYSIADRPGIAPGIIAGALALTGESHFFGAIFGGFIAGYSIELIKWLFTKWPKGMSGVKPMFIYPFFGALIVAFLMIGINYIFAPFSIWLEQEIINLNGFSLLITSIILGGLMAIDLGGPINKVAYIVGVISIIHGHFSILMAAIMASGMIPPLAIFLSVTLFKRDFIDQERIQAKQNLWMGLSFMTEGAIPFTKKYTYKVHLPIVIGSMFGAALVAIFQTSVPTPHGGIFAVFFMNSWWGFIIALMGGTIVSSVLIKLLMVLGDKQETKSV